MKHLGLALIVWGALCLPGMAMAQAGAVRGVTQLARAEKTALELSRTLAALQAGTTEGSALLKLLEANAGMPNADDLASLIAAYDGGDLNEATRGLIGSDVALKSVLDALAAEANTSTKLNAMRQPPGAAQRLTGTCGAGGTCLFKLGQSVESALWTAGAPGGARVDVDVQRQRVAVAAASLVEDGMYVGLGTGRTAAKMVEELARRMREEGLTIRAAVSTSERTSELARSLGINVVSLEEVPYLDIAIDGADEVDGSLDLVKGLGGALFREKMVQQKARRFVVIVDEEKLVTSLGRGPVPVEIAVFGNSETMGRLKALGTTPTLRVDGDGPDFFVTDNHNNIADLSIAATTRRSLKTQEGKTAFADRVKTLTGVVDHGFFLNAATDVFVATGDGRVVLIRRASEKP